MNKTAAKYKIKSTSKKESKKDAIILAFQKVSIPFEISFYIKEK